MIIGVTGTRNGMTPEQRHAFVGVIRLLRPAQFHHGDCVGADADACEAVREESPETLIVAHPPVNQTLRAHWRSDEERYPQSYMRRNAAIVAECDHLIATPKEQTGEPQGGTGATIKMARRAGKPVTIIRPNGAVETGSTVERITT